jgi:germination protein M
MRSLAASLAVLALLAAGCGDSNGEESGSTTPPPPPASTTSETETEPPVGASRVGVYFLREGKLGYAERSVAVTPKIATAALEELFAGPTDDEEGAGLTSDVPPNTKLESLTIAEGKAVARLTNPLDDLGSAQVVQTLLQFPTVKRVELDGREYASGDTEDALPPILVEAPAPNATVSSPLTIKGTANTFEATFMADLRADGEGKPLYSNFVTATSGSGTRGTFEQRLDFTVDRERPGKLVVYERSAEDGSVVNEVEIPVTIQP